jgi:hypothetical protein
MSFRPVPARLAGRQLSSNLRPVASTRRRFLLLRQVPQVCLMRILFDQGVFARLHLFHDQPIEFQAVSTPLRLLRHLFA